MKMYACRKVGRGYDIAKATEFSAIRMLDRENTAISMNKDVRSVFAAAGFPVEKENLPGGSMWLYCNAIQPVRDRFMGLAQSNPAYAMYANAISAFMSVCMAKGYDIRFY